MTLKLLFCKSQVYTHPTKNVQDNVAGFLLITRIDGSDSTEATVSWIPESNIDSEDAAFLRKAEMKNIDIKLLDLTVSTHKLTMLLSNGSFFSSDWQFSIQISSLYSIQFKLPNTWWYGSAVLYSKSARETDSIPILYFHDDMCPSTKSKQKELNKSFDPFNSSNEMYWGGQDFKDSLGAIVDLQRAVSEPTFWLINASLEDLRNFSSENLKREDNKPKSDVKASNDPVENLKQTAWDKWESTKWSVMSQFADLTAKTGTYMGNLIKRHPVVQLVEKNKDNYYVKKMLQNPKVVEIQDDFDSAKIYLAKWALCVKQEAEKYQDIEATNSYRKILLSEFGLNGNEDVKFTEEEMNRALERNHPLTNLKWKSLFDSQGRLTLTVSELKDFIFHGGLEDQTLRKEVWPFLLNVFPWDSSKDERDQMKTALNLEYDELKSRWSNEDSLKDIVEEEYWKDQLFRIEKDVKRNDRNVDIYMYNTVDGKQSTAKVQENEGDDHWTIHNPHLQILSNILKTYNIFNPNLGYVQGMTDLLSPLYYIVRDESLTFWCFVNFMERMERNFLRDQSGIRDQMLALTDLCQLMLPQLSAHLTKCDSSDLFFCFRMILVWFKREFNYDDIFGIWEVFFTDYYSSQYQLFFMLAILQTNSQPIIKNLESFDQVIKYFNELHTSLDAKDLMIRSELLFIQFEKTADLLARKKTAIEDKEFIEKDSEAVVDAEKEKIFSPHLQLLLSKKIVIQKEGERTVDSVK
ncbi:GTPase-activating protein GYP7 [Nakaseomyces bracarensis]|uniref:GTPase-activating protein GYP7 n=1 Tax=Nakaseomyces bracarensis TaxID=273131 RepID=A0ABR4NN76_9SACH